MQNTTQNQQNQKTQQSGKGKMTAQDLKREMERNEQLIVLNVLSESNFEKEHIPGSWNVPVGADDFLRQVREITPDMQRRIVVHCSGPDCSASAKAETLLRDAGYKNVEHFPGGMKAWKEQKFKVESGKAEHATAGR